MSETPFQPNSDPASAPGADGGQRDDGDALQKGAPATGPEAPVPPGFSEDADGQEDGQDA